MVKLVPDTFGPTLSSSNAPDGSRRGRAFRSVVLTFSEPIDAATLSAETIHLVSPTGEISPTNIQFRSNNRAVQLTYTTLEIGDHQLILDAAEIADRAGNAMGVNPIVTNFSIVDATSVWINPASGFWDDPTNWDSGVVPGKFDDVLIDAPGDITITYRSGNTEIRSLSSSNKLTLNGGTLTVAQTLEINNTLTLSGGTLKDATVVLGAGAELIVTSNGTLDGVRLDTDLLVDQGSQLTVRNGLVLNGKLTMMSGTSRGGASLHFEGTQTLSTTSAGEIVFAGATSPFRYDHNVYARGDSGSNPATLTIGPGVTVHGAAGANSNGHLQGFFANDAIINQGTILADVAGQTIEVADLMNSGMIEAANGATLIVNDLQNQAAGSVQADSSTLTFGGAWDNV